MSKHSQPSSGFTLVEATIIIIVLGIISTIAIISYLVYRQNAQNAQIASSVSAYQGAVNLMTDEHELYEGKALSVYSCLSSPSDANVCCYVDSVNVGGGIKLVCFNNTNMGYFGSPALATYSASDVTAWTKKVLPTTLPPALPPSSAQAECTSSTLMSATLWTDNLPCVAKNIGLQSYIQTDGRRDSYLVYFLPPDRDCQSKDVVTLLSFASSSPLAASYTNAKYTARFTGGSTPFTLCVVGIK